MMLDLFDDWQMIDVQFKLALLILFQSNVQNKFQAFSNVNIYWSKLINSNEVTHIERVHRLKPSYLSSSILYQLIVIVLYH